MSKKSKVRMFVACEEAMMCCDKQQYKEASLLEKIKLNVHVLFCRSCMAYSRNNNKLTKLMKRDELASFDNAEKSSLENAFREQLKNSQQ